MNRLFTTLIFTAAAGICAVAQEMADYRLQVQDFTELKVTDAINVDYRCSPDSAGWAYFTTTPEVAENLLFSNNKATLTIQLGPDIDDKPVVLPTIRVYSTALAKVENSADSTVRVLTNVPQPSFRAQLIGNGTLIVRQVRATNVDAGINTGNGHLVITHGTAARSERVVNVCSWGEYIDESLITEFEEQTGIRVNYQTAESNEALYSLIKMGRAGL